MSTPLFHNANISMEKVANSFKLEQDPDLWPKEILKVAYKMLPSLQNYEADIELDRVDQARGYAVGKILIFPPGLTKEAAKGNDKLISVPVIVRDKEMAPFDTYSYNDKMFPMEERAVQEILSDASPFQRVANKDEFKGDTWMDRQITPPETERQYGGGSQMKVASTNIWKATIPYFGTEKVASFKDQLKADHALRHAYTTSPVLRAYTADILSPVEKTASAIESLPLSVLQIRENGKSFIVKTANVKHWAPVEKAISRYDVQGVLSEEAFSRLLEDGYITVAVDPVITTELTEKVATEADRVGVYHVWAGSKALEGVVIPRMLTLDDVPMSAQLFLGDSLHALQEKVAGVFEKDITIQGTEPRGKGVFVYQEGDKALAYEPVEIHHKVVHEKLAHYLGRRLATGEPIRLYIADGLNKVAALGGGDYALPATMKFMKLAGKQQKVSEDVETAHLFEHQKTAGEKSATLRHSFDTFWLEGANTDVFRGQNMDKIAAEFALCALGLTGTQAREAIKTASAKDWARIPKTRGILNPEVLKVASAKINGFYASKLGHLNVNTFREVALLTDSTAQELLKQASIDLPKESVDSILSLNFVTPENASVYVSYLPILEKSASVLAEILVASRLGMDDVREAAAKNAMTQLNAVIRGLEQLNEKIQ